MTNLIDVKFRADVKELENAIKSVKDLGTGSFNLEGTVSRLVGTFAKGNLAVALLGGAVVATAGAVAGLIRHAIALDEHLIKLSNSTGIAVDQIQAIQIAFKLGGANAETMEKSMVNLNKMVGEAADPFSKAAEQLHALGVSQEEIRKGDTAAIFSKLTQELNQYADGAQKSAVQNILFGKSGKELNDAIKEYEANLKIANTTLDEYGIRITPEAAKASKELGDTVEIGMSMFERLGKELKDSTVPALQILATEFADSGKEGGVLHVIISDLSSILQFFAATLMSVVVEPIRIASYTLHVLGLEATAVKNALSALATGDVAGAGKVFDDLANDLRKVNEEFVKTTIEFEKKNWGKVAENLGLVDKAMQGVTKSTEAQTKSSEGLQRVLNPQEITIRSLSKELDEQTKVYGASRVSVELYTRALTELAIQRQLQAKKVDTSTEEGRKIESIIRQIEETKRLTAENVTGLGVLNNIKLTLEGTRVAQLGITEALTMSSKQIERNSQLRQLELDKQKALKDATGDHRDAIIAMYDEAIAKQKTLNKEIDVGTSGYQGMVNGAEKGLAEWMDTAGDMSKQTSELVSGSLDKMTDSLTEFVMTGKMDFKSLALSIIAEIEKMIIKWLILTAIKQVAGYADGGVFENGSVKPMASGDVVNSPTFFPMANGSTGLMGEAGPEAVMPLRRMSNGKLGVESTGGGNSGGGNVIIQNVNVTTQAASGETEDEAAQRQARAIRDTLRPMIVSEIRNQQRPGNSLNQNAYGLGT